MLYIDTSAFLKLLVDEEFSGAMRPAIANQAPWSSSLLGVEAHRAARRLGIESETVDAFLASVTLVTLSETTLQSARSVGSDELRTLDALHLAAALELGVDLEAVITYDIRLARACDAAEVRVIAPGTSPGWYLGSAAQ